MSELSRWFVNDVDREQIELRRWSKSPLRLSLLQCTSTSRTYDQSLFEGVSWRTFFEHH